METDLLILFTLFLYRKCSIFSECIFTGVHVWWDVLEFYIKETALACIYDTVIDRSTKVKILLHFDFDNCHCGKTLIVYN